MKIERYEPLTALTREEILDDLEKIAAKLWWVDEWGNADSKRAFASTNNEHNRALDWLHDLLSENGR